MSDADDIVKLAREELALLPNTDYSDGGRFVGKLCTAILEQHSEIVRLRGLVTRLRHPHPLGLHVFLMAPSDGFCIVCDRVENDPIHKVGP